MRNNTNYMETGVLSALELTAGFPKTVLENFYHEEPQLDRVRRDGGAVRLRDSRGPADMTRVAFIVNMLRHAGHRSRARPRPRSS